ncbi:CDP-alcohol phosphatidyltransferase family protein [Candidatus Woesearchaeota archaeon]|nr:CDP-alcohol phosphatidyltransferase family protein [Candidatus Woesearchaeota archaeon]
MVESIKQLRIICYDSPYAYRVWFNKYVSKLSIYVTWLLLHTKIEANHVTIIEFFLVFLSSIFLFFGKLSCIFAGIMIIQFTNLLDCVDGEIARYRKKSSLTGVHLENIYHELVSYLMFFPLAFGVFLQTGWKSVLIFGFLCSVFSKSVVIPSMLSAVVNSKLHGDAALDRIKSRHIKNVGRKSVNLQGSDTGKKLNDIYNKFKDFWAAPTNILHLTVISIIELINLHYNFMPSYILFYWYLLIYAVGAILKQVVSFLVHYKGRAAEQHYKALFGGK